MRRKLLFVIAVLLLAVGAGAGNKAGAAPVSAPMVSHSAASGSALLIPARWACWTVPGSGLGRQCRWKGQGQGQGRGRVRGRVRGRAAGSSASRVRV